MKYQIVCSYLKMTIYILHHSDESGMSIGHEYATSKKDVAIRTKRIEDDGDQVSMVTEHKVRLNKKDILSFLNHHCAYADNG